MTVMIALVAALLAGAGLVLQQRAAEQAPKASFLRLRLFADLIRRPRWLAGIAVMAGGQLLSVWVLGHLALSVAEPLLASSLIFALLLAAPLSGQPLRATGVPPTFRTADPLGFSPERTGSRGREIPEVLT